MQHRRSSAGTSINLVISGLKTRLTQSFSGTSRRTFLAIIPAASIAAFSWVGLTANSQPSDNLRNAEPKPLSSPQAESVPDPKAPAAASDDPSVAAPPSGQASGASTSVKITEGQARVEVNNQEIPVPKNGTYSRKVTNPDGSQSNVSISSQNINTGTTSNQSTSFSSSTVQSNSSTTSHIRQDIIINGERIQ